MQTIFSPDIYVGIWTGTGVGTAHTSGTSTGTVQWLAYGFTVPPGTGSFGATCNLSSIRLCVKTVSGTISSGTLVLDVYPGQSGLTYNAPPTGSGGALFSYSLPAISTTGWYLLSSIPQPDNVFTAGQRYWLVLRNTSATPSANFVVFDYRDILGPDSPQYGIAMATKAATGTSWSVSKRVWGGIHMTFTNGGEFGIPAIYSGLQTGYVYGGGTTGRIAGFNFTVPGGYGLRVRGFSTILNRTGSGCALQPMIINYTSNTIVASGYAVPSGTLYRSSGSVQSFWFNSAVTLQPGTQYRIVLRDPDGTSTSSNCWRYAVIRMYDATELNKIPFGIVACESTNGGSTWTDHTTNLYVPAVAMLLLEDGSYVYVQPGSGGGTGIVPATDRRMT